MTEPILQQCRPTDLPDSLLVMAAIQAWDIHPLNKPYYAPGVMVPDPLSIAGQTRYFWESGQTITWMFVDNADATTRRMMGESFARVAEHANLNFRETQDRSQAMCRIARLREGYYSYIGTGNLTIAIGRHTMNLQEFTAQTPYAEWLRVADHEILHLIGIIHGQQTKWIVDQLDPAGCYAEFGSPPNSWTRKMIDSQILTPQPMSELTDFGPEGMETSLSTYAFSSRCTKSRKPIPGGTRLTAKDARDLRAIYPGRGGEPVPPPKPGGPGQLVIGGAGILDNIDRPGAIDQFAMDVERAGTIRVWTMPSMEIGIYAASGLPPVLARGYEDPPEIRLEPGPYVVRVKHRRRSGIGGYRIFAKQVS